MSSKLERKKIVAETLKAMQDKKGRLTAEEVVASAEDPKHPLHNEFEWDNSVAGHNWRLEQARVLIRSVHFVVETVEYRSVVPQYVRDPDALPNKQGYRNVVSLSRDKSSAREAVIAEFKVAQAHLRRARDVASGLGFADEIEDFIYKLLGLEERVRSSTPSGSKGAQPQPSA